jgi:serine/threonine protein kinase
MRGGKVIGQGTYGCAVSPPMLCRGQSRNEYRETPQQKVGKLTSDMDAENELLISKVLRKSSLWKHYFVLPELETCEPANEGSQDWEACRITKKEDSQQLRQVISDFGGRSFSSLGTADLRPGSFDFFFFMKHLLEGGALLLSLGVVHFDLHRSNVLIDEHGVPRFLDFGMSFVGTQITEDTLSNRWKQYDPKFDSESPEITIITGLRNKKSLAEAIDECIYEKPIFQTVEDVLDITHPQLKDQMTVFLGEDGVQESKSKTFKKQDWLAFWKVYWPGFDSFSLGALLLNVLKIQLTFNSFVESADWKEKEAIITFILTKMTNPDPSERYDCVEALALYDPANVVLKNSRSWLEARMKQRKD